MIYIKTIFTITAVTMGLGIINYLMLDYDDPCGIRPTYLFTLSLIWLVSGSLLIPSFIYVNEDTMGTYMGTMILLIIIQFSMGIYGGTVLFPDGVPCLEAGVQAIVYMLIIWCLNIINVFLMSGVLLLEYTMWSKLPPI